MKPSILSQYDRIIDSTVIMTWRLVMYQSSDEEGGGGDGSSSRKKSRSRRNSSDTSDKMDMEKNEAEPKPAKSKDNMLLMVHSFY